MKIKKSISILILCTLLVLTFSIGVSAADIPFDRMLAMYNMEGSLTNSVTGAEGTLMNGAGFVQDSERGTVLFLNNADVVSPGNLGFGGYDIEGQHAILADNYVPTGDAITLSLWFKAAEIRNWARVIDMGDGRAQDEFQPNDPQRFINISTAGGPGNAYTIGTTNMNDIPSGSDGERNRDRVFAPQATVNEWIHVAYVTHAGSGNPPAIYINGERFEGGHGDDSFAPTDPAYWSPSLIHEHIDGVGLTFLGRSRFEGNADAVFYGWIDDVTIFDVALTSAQIQQLAAHDFAAPEAPPAEEAPPEADPAPPAADPTPPPAAQPTQAPQTFDPIVLVVVVSFVSIAAIIVLKKRKTVN